MPQNRMVEPTDVERSRAFHREILRLREIDRPPFDFPEINAERLD
jgi:hypothetical protein